VMERAVLLCRGSEVTLADLPSGLSDAPARPAGRSLAALGPPAEWLDRPIAEVRREADSWVERRYLEEQLKRCGGRVGETAARAGITSRSLYSRMRAHGLRKEDFRPGARRVPSAAAES